MSEVLRIYQSPLSSDGWRFVYMPLRTFKAAGYDHPPRRFYEKVYEGSLPSWDPETIFTIFNLRHPTDYKARSLSVSDVIELADDTHSEFYFCDTIGFARIQFE